MVNYSQINNSQKNNMNQEKVSRIVKKLRKKLEETGKLQEITEGNYDQWKDFMGPIFDGCRMPGNDREWYGKKAIIELRKILKEERENKESSEFEKIITTKEKLKDIVKIRKGKELEPYEIENAVQKALNGELPKEKLPKLTGGLFK